MRLKFSFSVLIFICATFTHANIYLVTRDLNEVSQVLKTEQCNSERSKTYLNLQDTLLALKTVMDGKNHTAVKELSLKVSKIYEELRISHKKNRYAKLSQFAFLCELQDKEKADALSRDLIDEEMLERSLESELKTDLDLIEQDACLTKEQYSILKKRSSDGLYRLGQFDHLLATLAEVSISEDFSRDIFMNTKNYLN